MSKELLNPEKALIFRIVHKDNIGPILEDGCHCRSTMDGKKYMEIGNSELIQKRVARAVPSDPGGTLSDYVPFYFTPYSPMLYNIKTGYNGVPQRPMQDILILVSSLHHLKDKKIPFVFSDRHAYLRTAQFSNDLADLDWIIWPSLQIRDFKRDDADKFEKYQAEALIHKHVPLIGLLGIACYNDEVKSDIEVASGKHKAAIKVIKRRDWFL